MARLALVTHTDLDGVASAAIYLRIAGLSLDDASLTFTEPYHLPRVLADAVRSADHVAVMDLGANTGTLEGLVEAAARAAARGVRLEWYDHHRWREEWMRALMERGVRLHVDTTTCAAGVVARYAPRELGREADGFVERLVSATCAADLWRWDDPLAPRLYRVAGRYRGSRGDAWRREMVRRFAEGRLWWEELDEALEEYMRLEFEGFDYALGHVVVAEAAGCRIAATLKKPGPPTAGVVGASLLYRYDADIAVIVRVRGRGVSLRSRGINVQRIAAALGGGGHPRAAGIPLSLPWYKAVVALVWPRIRLRHALQRVARAVAEAGGCAALRG